MFEIQYLDKTSNEILVSILVAKKLSTAKSYAKNFILHNANYSILSITPCQDRIKKLKNVKKY